MPKPGDVIEAPDLNLRFEILATGESTGGEYAEFEVYGRPRGFIKLMHVHEGVTERHEVLEGVLNVKLDGKVHALRPGDSIEIPPGAAHYQRASGGDARVRIRHTPAGRIDEFVDRLREVEFDRFGFPKPMSGARFVLDLGASGHAARPSLKTQQRIARALLAEYEFVDEWHVDAPPEAVFDVLADGQTYPQWWKPVYIDVRDDGEYTHQHFKGRLRYHLHTRTKTVAPSAPTFCRAKPTATCAVPGSGRSPRARVAARTCASTGACTPTASCCARSPRSCVRPCAGTTTGRSPARWTGWSRSCSAKRWSPERDAGHEGA